MTNIIITIGRDEATGSLLLTTDGVSTLYGQSGSVPPDIGKEHFQLAISDSLIRLRNLDINNYTYVNGQIVESKTINIGDKITLGTAHYHFDWDAITIIVADIRPLEQVWNMYEQKSLSLVIDERKFNTLRSITGVITMVAIALSLATGGRSKLYVVLYALAIIASIALFIKAYRDASKIPQRRQDMNRQFQHDYVCPHCKRFLGNQSYDLVAQNSHCPYCKTNFIH